MFVQAILFPAILGGFFIMLVQVKLVQAYFEMILVCLSISFQFWSFFPFIFWNWSSVRSEGMDEPSIH